MKKSIKTTIIFSLFLLVSAGAFSQSCGNMTTRQIELSDSSDNESIELDVSKDIKCLMIGVGSTIESGSLTMEIFDPKGDKQGNFSVESQISSSAKKKEKVCGQLNKTFKDPMPGTWVVKLKPKKVTGTISILSNMGDDTGAAN